MKKILIVTNMYPSVQKKYAGIFVKNQYEKLKELAENDVVIDIFFMRRTFTSKAGSVLKYITTFFRFIPNYFKKYDVIHLHYFFPLILFVWLYKLFYPKTKLLVTFHGSDINTQVNESNKKTLSFFARKIDYSIPVGKEIQKKIKEKLSLTKGEVLPVGINDKMFYHMPEVQKKYDFIYVGSFFHIKGIDVLFETLEKLDKSIVFCVVGKGQPYEDKIKTLIEKGYNITLKIDQSHDQLRVLYNQSKFLFSPSRSEGFPTVTLEAMYCGTPVLTSDIPQFKEQVVEGFNGYTFSLENKDSIPAFLNEQLKPTKDYSKLKEGSLNSFKELSLTKVCSRLLKIYSN